MPCNRYIATARCLSSRDIDSPCPDLVADIVAIYLIIIGILGLVR